MFSTVALAALAASVAVARPLPFDNAVLAAVDASLQLPTTVQNNSVAYYWQNGNAGACGLYSQDSDLVVGLPLEFYNDTGSVSPYCGSYVVVLNPVNNATVVSRVEDASATPELLSLSVGTWRALNGDGTDLSWVTWRFANKTEVAAAKASLANAAFTATTTPVAAAAATSSPAAQQQEQKTTTTQAPTTTATPVKTSSTTTWVAPTTTQQPKTTTTTQQWTPTTTSYKPAQTTQAQKQQSSGGSGSYSGQATYFYQNGVAGACGKVNSDSAYIVALDSAMYSGGAHCGQQVTIYGNGKSVTATVADECPTCASSGSLDLSVAAFNALASESDGVASITWSFS